MSTLFKSDPNFKITNTRFIYPSKWDYLKKARVLVCGDAMMDHYWSGRAKSISPEAPVPVYLIEDVDMREGAAANVANNIEAMGVPCERMFGGSTERINKIRVIAKDQHIARIDFDPPQSPITVNADYENAVSRCTVVVFVDYGKGSLREIRKLIAKARELGCFVIIDPKGHDFAKYRGANIIKPNQEEMRELVGGWANQHELDIKAHKFLLDAEIDGILLTQAEHGMTLYEHGNTHHREASTGPVVDVSGAGEAALAGFSAAIARGFAQSLAMDCAAKAAAACISRFGTTVVTAAEIGL